MVPSLYDLCMRTCIKNVELITDVGDMSYLQIRDVLIHVTSAKQLKQLEQNSPQIVGEDAEIWREIIQRDFFRKPNPSAIPAEAPSDELWSLVWDRHVQEEKDAFARAEKKLKDTMNNHFQKKADSKALIVNPRLIPGKVRPRGVVSKNLTWGGGSRTTGSDSASIMKRARREAAEVAARRGLSNRYIDVRPHQIFKAPAAMVDEHRIKSQPKFTAAPPPRKRSLESAGIAEKEARLLQLKKQKVNVLTEEELLEGRSAGASSAKSGPDKKSTVHAPRAGGLLSTIRRPGLLSKMPKPVVKTVRVPTNSSPQKHAPTSSRPAQGSRLSPPRGSQVNSAKAQPSHMRPSHRSAPSISPPTTPEKPTDSAAKAQPSPPKDVAAAGSHPPKPPPRRKPVDIFMRSKKKVVR